MIFLRQLEDLRKHRSFRYNRMKSLFLVRTKTFNLKNTTDLSIIALQALHVILGFPQWFLKVSEGRSFSYRVDDCDWLR